MNREKEKLVEEPIAVIIILNLLFRFFIFVLNVYFEKL